MREFKLTGENIPANRTWKRDYIHDDHTLLASVRRDGTTRHYHTDHLGTPRLITDASGAQVGRHDYLPYGEEVSNPAQNDEVMKYTVHQRDENNPGTDDDLDYMLARYYSPHLGRFQSLDPHPGEADKLQTLNRYAYSRQNPIRYLDPDGRLVAQFRGGLSESGDNQNGLDKLQDQCYSKNGASLLLFGATRTFGWEAAKLGTNADTWIRRSMQNNPNQPLIITGNSHGASRAVGLANGLAADGIIPDLLVLLDPWMGDEDLDGGPLEVDARIRTIHYYTGSKIGSKKGDVVGDLVETKFFPGSHGKVDDDPMVRKAVCDSSTSTVRRKRIGLGGGRRPRLVDSPVIGGGGGSPSELGGTYVFITDESWRFPW